MGPRGCLDVLEREKRVRELRCRKCESVIQGESLARGPKLLSIEGESLARGPKLLSIQVSLSLETQTIVYVYS